MMVCSWIPCVKPVIPNRSMLYNDHIMKPLLILARLIDRLNAWVGKSVSWLVLAVVVVTFAVVVMRYGFQFGRIWIQESYLWMHAVVFMLGAAWTLQDGGHVCVDVLHRKLSPRAQSRINLLGVILLLVPTCMLILWISLPYVVTSWQLMEGSRQTGGIPAIFLLKSIIPLAALLLLLQGISMAIHNAARIMGLEDFPADCESNT